MHTHTAPQWCSKLWATVLIIVRFTFQCPKRCGPTIAGHCNVAVMVVTQSAYSVPRHINLICKWWYRRCDAHSAWAPIDFSPERMGNCLSLHPVHWVIFEISSSNSTATYRENYFPLSECLFDVSAVFIATLRLINSLSPCGVGYQWLSGEWWPDAHTPNSVFGFGVIRYLSSPFFFSKCTISTISTFLSPNDPY